MEFTDPNEKESPTAHDVKSHNFHSQDHILGTLIICSPDKSGPQTSPNHLENREEEENEKQYNTHFRNCVVLRGTTPSTQILRGEMAQSYICTSELGFHKVAKRLIELGAEEVGLMPFVHNFFNVTMTEEVFQKASKEFEIEKSTMFASPQKEESNMMESAVKRPSPKNNDTSRYRFQSEKGLPEIRAILGELGAFDTKKLVANFFVTTMSPEVFEKASKEFSLEKETEVSLDDFIGAVTLNS